MGANDRSLDPAQAAPEPGPQAPARAPRALWWVLGGLGVLALLALVVIGIVMNRAFERFGVQTGGDAIDTISAANPDVDVLTYSERRGILIFRDRSTGKRYRVPLNSLRNHRIPLNQATEEPGW